MKFLLKITGLVEAMTGLGLVIVPSFIVTLLLGTALSDPAALVLGRLAGAALVTIAFACYFSKGESQSSLMVKAMLAYNIIATALLVYAGLVQGLAGPGLWPAIVLHVALLTWCIFSLTRRAAGKAL